MIAKRDEEREAILEFANYFVKEVFEGAFFCDRARLAGHQINIIRDTCEFLYRLKNDREYRDKAVAEDETIASGQTPMQVPTELVPNILEMIKQYQSSSSTS
jgi:hypothetical protein